ncbi:Probable Rho GTPase-activating protein CG5521 [Gryllus bimaculatus]|nr:Probable Rho GTPase-activating protein CG5521 [Gryllus bimaculatus]
MFSKKLHADVKKSTQKIQDLKKDSATRLKHLKIVLEHVEADEAKNFFESNFSHIYYILYDSFVTAEANLRQRVHKAHREELECVLQVLERVLLLLPELVSRRWQCHSLTRIMAKLLHPGNSCRLRRDALRYFLLWYQALGDNAPDTLHAMFATLVPGFPSPFQGLGPVSAVDILPLLPPQSGEKQPDDPMKFFLDALLELIVSQVPRIEWRDRLTRQHKCFVFLFERFKQFYLPHIFPQFSHTTSLYRPVLDLPILRKSSSGVTDTPEGRRRQDPFIGCRVAVIKWVALFTHVTKKGDVPLVQTHSSSEDTDHSPGTELRRVSVSQVGSNHDAASPMSDSNNSSVFSHSDGGNHSLSEDPTAAALQLVRDVLYSSRDNVNFVHEVYRQAFLLNFTHSPAIRKAIAVYKDWIQMNVPELPPFMLEPLESHKEDGRSGPPSYEYSSMDSSDMEPTRVSRLRNDSYLGAIHRENLLVRAGLQNLLQVFISHAANVFMLEVSAEYPLLLEEQVDTCKRVLNIYRYMLLLVLLRITSLILSKTPPKRKEETLGGKLAPAIFQTLIVTWIKANLNVVISPELWDQFLMVLSSLTHWEELIREWAKTLETLTRVLARHVYNLDLTDLPLDRLTEQKAKRRRAGGSGGGLAESSSRTTGPATREASTSRPLRTTDRQNVHSAVDHSGAEEGPCSFPSNADSRSTGTVFASSGSPRKRRGSVGEASRQGHLLRSASENNLSGGRISSHKRRAHPPPPSPAGLLPTTLPDRVEQEVARLLASPPGSHHSSAWSQRSRLHRKSHSMDSLQGARGSPSQYSGSEGPTRSPSPAPSSGVESNSIKDSPMQIDVISGDGTSLELIDGNLERRSVMAGGTVRGWLPDVAVVLWRRMLGALGDINEISSPALHSQVFEYLVELCDTLTKIRLNQGVSADNQVTPPPPDLVPPIGIIAPWCFKALMLPESYHQGKLRALRLLCHITVVPQDLPPPRDHIAEFYRILHNGLVGTDQAVVNTLVRYCGPRFFSLMLPGHSLLMLDFIHAANTVVCSSDLSGLAPRTEATSILGALVCLPQPLTSVPVLQPSAGEFNTIPCPDAKEYVLSVLLRCGKREPAALARCIALSSLGMYVYQQLLSPGPQSRVREAVNVLLLALRLTNRSVGRVAADILLLLCDHANSLVECYPDLPPRIIEVAALTLAQLAPTGDRHLLTSLMFCLGEWCMQVPIRVLTEPYNQSQKAPCLLQTVLCQLQSGSSTMDAGTTTGLFPPEYMQDFEPSIQVDNLREASEGPVAPPAGLSVKLAARMVVMHLVNHLGHFPMGIGAARLSSLVVEHDDVPGLVADELSAEVFAAPNIQLFVVSDHLLVSLVELPALEVPGGGVTAGLCTAPSQVRVLLRDLSGKACWDASILHCSPEDAPRPSCQQARVRHNRERDGSERQSSVSLMASSLLYGSAHCPPQHTLRHRPPNQLPTWENAAEDMDNLDDYIGHTSPECLESLDTPRNIPAPPPPPLSREAEEDAITTVLGQRNAEQEFLALHACEPIGALPAEVITAATGPMFRAHSPLVSLEDISSNGSNIRARCRETHKVAVVYVAEGQEDKNSILSNTCGSQAYEEFIAGLAWEVELESHTGFLGDSSPWK